MFPFRNGEKTPFLLVNVAHDAQTTTAIEDMPIKFEALVEFASMEPSTVDLASLADAIDAPFEIELETYQAVLMHDRHEASGDTFMGLGHAAGVESPCLLTLSGSAPQRVGAFFPDALVLQMRTSGPITAGQTYQIRSNRKTRNLSDLTPNVAVVSTLISEGDGQQYAYDVEHGQLKIDSVAGNLLRGRLTGEGVYFEWSTQTLQYEARKVQQLAVKFSIRVQAPLGPYRNRPYACLQPRVSGAGTGGAPPAPGTPGPPATPPDAGGPPPLSGSPGPPAAPPGVSVPGTTGGGGASGSSPGDAAASPARPSEAATAAVGPGRTRWVSVRAQGRPDLSFAGSDLNGTAGVALVCFGAHSPARLVLHKGPPGQTNELALNVTAVGVAEGATGTFRLEQVQYVVPGAALSGRGPATLEITRHTASADPAARRMVGRIVGLSVLDPQTRGAITIEADFDVNTACAPFGR